jgi:hypothetical protein
MAFTNFKSLAQVQQEYNIKYSEESLFHILIWSFPIILGKNLNLTWKI